MFFVFFYVAMNGDFLMFLKKCVFDDFYRFFMIFERVVFWMFFYKKKFSFG